MTIDLEFTIGFIEVWTAVWGTVIYAIVAVGSYQIGELRRKGRSSRYVAAALWPFSGAIALLMWLGSAWFEK